MGYDRVEKLQQHAARGGLPVKSVSLAERDGSGWGETASAAVFGGTLSPDQLYTFECVAPSGARATLYQPFVRGIQLPGEFHATVMGQPSGPLEVRGAGFFQREARLRYVLSAICVATLILLPVAIYLLFFYNRPKLVGRDGKVVTVGPKTAEALRRLRFSASVGRARHFPTRLLTVKPAADGTSECIMYAADYGGFVAKDPGFGVFADLCRALSDELPRRG